MNKKAIISIFICFVVLAATVLTATVLTATVRAETVLLRDRYVEVYPEQPHEDCFPMGVGHILSYEFSSPVPLLFNLHYHEGDQTHYADRQDAAAVEGGEFTADTDREYCLMWVNDSGAPALLTYGFSVYGH